MFKFIWAFLLNFLGALLFATGCTGGPSLNGGQPHLINITNSNSFLGIQRRFVNYSRNAKRASLFDSQLETEVLGYFVGDDIVGAMGFADNTALGVYSPSQFTVLAREGSVSFAVDGWQTLATTGSAIVFANTTGTQAQILRYKSNGQWQNSKLIATNSSGITSTKLLPILKSDGNRLLLLFPETGALSIFTASTAAEDISSSGLSCNLGATSMWSAYYYDSAINLLYLGNQAGVVYRLDLTGSICPTMVNKINLSTATGVSGLTKFARVGEVLVATQEDGNVSLINVAGSTLSLSKTFTNLCSYPVFPSEGKADQLAMLCLSSAKTKAVFEVEYQAASFFLYDLSAEKTNFDVPIQLDRLATFAIDGDLGKLFFVKNSALGSMDIYSLETFSSRSKNGFWISDIFR